MEGLFVIRRIVLTPRSTRIWEPMPYSRESAGNPSSTLASTVSRPSSWSVYARSLWPRPMPRPSWPRRYTTTPRPVACDPLERVVELHAAVAAQRPEDVAGEALGVDADQHVLVARDVAPDEGQVLHSVEQALEDVRGEVAVAGRDARLGHAPHELLAVPAVADEVRDRDELQAVLGGELLQLGHPGHRAVVVGDLARARPTGTAPASRARSTAASVWPARLSTPPSR